MIIHCIIEKNVVNSITTLYEIEVR